MEKIEVNTIEELKKARDKKVDEIIVKGELVNYVKRASLIKKTFYWLIIGFLLLGLNFLIASKVIDFYSVFQLKAFGIKRILSVAFICLIVTLIFIFGILSSKVCNYKLSYIDRFFESNNCLFLYKVWYF